jgi:hypothetical protein
MLNLVISCGENTNKTTSQNDLCENITCGEFGECKVVEDASLDSQSIAICSCNEGYHEENMICIEDELTKVEIRTACEKMVPCYTAGEENIELCVVKYDSFYRSELNSIYAYYMPIGKRIKDYIGCVNEHIECSEYNSCYNELMGITYSEEVCSNTNSECSSDILKTCKDGKYIYNDCSVINKKCLTYSDTQALCSNDTLCEQNNFENYCNEKGSLVYCNNGITQEYYCPYYGQECRIDNDIANCYLKPNTPSCEVNNETSCEEGNMVLCRSNKKLTTSCVELFGENFTCMSFSYPSGDFTKNTYGCFYE